MTTGNGFFRSRWVDPPRGVDELDPAELPLGFRASGVACGIKSEGLDLGMVVCDSEAVTSAARFTRNAVVGAPVELNLSEASLDILRAVVVNSGRANVCTGSEGLAVAQQTRDAAARALGVHPHHVAIASTGVIGSAPPAKSVVDGVLKAVAALDRNGGRDFGKAILTTDKSQKQVSLGLDVGGRMVRLSAQAKGAGMIAPSFSSATLLCFVQTDAALVPGALQAGLDRILGASLERVTVDAQLSTSDSFFLMASGSSGADCSDEADFFQALQVALLQLGLELVSDGEGATTVTRLIVTGAHDGGEAERVARAVADSPLVKSAAFGGDPNWGRVVQAAGAAIGLHANHRETVRPSLWLEDRLLCERGIAVVPDEDRAQLAGLMRQDEVELTLDLHRGEHATEIYFSDLTHDYIKLNTEYS